MLIEMNIATDTILEKELIAEIISLIEERFSLSNTKAENMFYACLSTADVQTAITSQIKLYLEQEPALRNEIINCQNCAHGNKNSAIFYDSLGRHTICKSCKSSFDV